MNTRIKTISVLLIMLALISPPFVFAELKFFGKEIRGLIGLTVIILLYLENTKFTFSELFIFFLLGLIIILELLSKRSDLNNVLSAYAVIFVAYSILRVLKTNKLSGKIFLQFWMRFSLIISIFAIISFFINQFTNLDIIFEDINSTVVYFNPDYNYKISIFGFSVFKNFGFIGIERVSSYFNEPQYAGMFFAFNILIASKNNKLFPKKYYISSILAGLLTFSVTFYMAYIVYLIFTSKVYKIKIIFLFSSLLIIILIIFYFLNISLDFLDLPIQTSFQDRMERNLNALTVLNDANFFKILFGHGVNTFQNINPDEGGVAGGRGLSSGFLYLLFEFGILISLLIFTMFISFSNKNYTLILVGILYLIAIPWHKYYFCWYAIILCGLNYFDTFSYKRPFSKRNLENYKTKKDLLS
jgi:hypothetical protein